jgi:hypothetical protein
MMGKKSKQKIPDEVRDIILSCARGDYQSALLSGRGSWSGRDLKGKAKKYSWSYSDSRSNLLERINDNIMGQRFEHCLWTAQSKLVPHDGRWERRLIVRRASGVGPRVNEWDFVTGEPVTPAYYLEITDEPVSLKSKRRTSKHTSVDAARQKWRDVSKSLKRRVRVRIVQQFTNRLCWMLHPPESAMHRLAIALRDD